MGLLSPAAFAAGDALHHEQLPNGMAVSVVSCPECPVASLRLWYHVGSVDEEPGTLGFAHLFEHLMFGGSKSFSKRALDQIHHASGGFNNARTSFDETVYESDVPVQALLSVLKIEADRMTNLTLTEENLANEKKIVTEELRLRAENDVVARILMAVQTRALEGHPYGHSPIGTKQDIAAATLEHAQRFYRDFYRPNRAHLVIVGPLDVEPTLAEVRQLFGSLPAGGPPSRSVAPLTGRAPAATQHLTEEIPPVEVAAMIYPLPSADAPDAAAVRVMQQLLAWGSVDPFEQELVQGRRKAVLAGAESFALRRAGLLAFYSAAIVYRRERSAWRFMHEAVASLSRLEWLTDDSLAAAKRALVNETLTAEYYAAQRAEAVGRALWWEGDPHKAFTTGDALNAVTREDVTAAFREYVVDAEPYQVYVRPKRVPLWVRLFGWVYPLVSK